MAKTTGRPRSTRIAYTPADIEQMGAKEVRKTYTQLRRIAKARLKYLNKVFPNNAYQKAWKNEMPELKSMKRISTVREHLAEISRFLRQGTTVTRYRERLENIRNDIFRITKVDLPLDKIDDFLEFEEDLINRYGAKVLDSDEVASLYKLALDTNISTANILKEYSFYKKNKEELKMHADKLLTKEGHKRSRKWTAEMLRKEFGYE